MTFNRNLPQVVFCSLSQSEWALSLLSHWEGLSPSIQSFLPDDVTVLRGLGQKRGSGERKSERETEHSLIWSASFTHVCVLAQGKCWQLVIMLSFPFPTMSDCTNLQSIPATFSPADQVVLLEGYPYTIYVVFFSEHVSGLLHWDFSGSVSHFCKYPLHGVS